MLAQLQAQAAALGSAQQVVPRSQDQAAPQLAQRSQRARGAKASQRGQLQRAQVTAPQAALYQLTDNGYFVIGAIAGESRSVTCAQRHVDQLSSVVDSL